MPKKYQAKKIEEGVYEYRGYTINRRDDVAPGYFGRWYTGTYKKGFASDTLKGVKVQIDIRLDGNN